MADGSSTSPNKETVTLRLPSGEMVDAIVPAGFSDGDLKSYVRMKRPDLFGAPAGVQKPNVNMTTGEGPIAAGMTSMETQLSQMPAGMWNLLKQSWNDPKFEAVGTVAQGLNPVQKVDAGTPAERMDWGATAANVLPWFTDLGGRGIGKSPALSLARGAASAAPNVSASDALAAAKAVGKVAVKDAAAHIPLAGRLVQRPSIMDYVRAAQTKAEPPPVNPALTTQSRTLPGMNPPEVIRPPAQTTQPIPPRSGLMLPGDTEKVIPASKVSTTPPTKSAQVAQAKGIPAVKDMSTVLPRLREIAQQIQAKEATTPANADLTPELQKSLPQARIQGKIMQVVRREGTLGMDRLMEAPELKGISRQQVEDAATSLGNSKKLWVPTKEADAHGPAGIISLALRKH